MHLPLTLFNSQAANVGPLTVTGASPQVNLRYARDITLSCIVTAAPTGTSPTLDVYLDVFDANGQTISGLIHPAQLTGSNLAANASTGLHTAGFVLPEYAQIRWVLGGTNPSFAVSLTLTGR